MLLARNVLSKKCWLGATIFLQNVALNLKFPQFDDKVLYDYAYMIGYDEDGERFKFTGSLFAYKPFIINALRFLHLPNYYLLPWI